MLFFLLLYCFLTVIFFSYSWIIYQEYTSNIYLTIYDSILSNNFIQYVNFFEFLSSYKNGLYFSHIL